jgi:hypothetical protein
MAYANPKKEETMSELQRVEVRVTFPGELLASYTNTGGTTYRLFRHTDYELGLPEEPVFFVHWESEDGTAWLEHGPGGTGMTWAQVAQGWPPLVENLEVEDLD